MLAQLSADAPPRKNVFISPASIALALSMTANGADDPTAQAILNLLRLSGLNWDAVNQAHAALWQALSQVDPQITLSMANSLWAEPGFPFADTYRNTILDYYEAEISNIDFGDAQTAAQTINQWVEEKTQEKIKGLLTPNDLSAAVLVLVNAIYFKGEWANTFDKARTQDGDFHLASGAEKMMPMMQRKGAYHYRETADYQLISLPFGQGQLSMVILLPSPDNTLAHWRQNLNAENWAAMVGNLLPLYARPKQSWDPRFARYGRENGAIILPRFKIAYKQEELLSYLNKMGLTNTSFPHMANPPDPLLFISKVIHQTFLEVNEEGAEAAAATAVVIGRGMSAPPFKMVVDRPFFCAIQDNLTGAILFMGTIYEPETT